MPEDQAKLFWERFIAELNRVQPIKGDNGHISFLGSISSYRKIFMAANKSEQ
jgi:hypothetical protein